MANNLKTEDVYSLVIDTRKLLQKIKKGVCFDGQHRRFGLLDYYEFMNIRLDKLYEIVNPYLTKPELEILSGFIKRYSDEIHYTKSNEGNLLSTKITIGVKFDEAGNEIKGTGRVVSEEEKQAIVADLRERKIPVTRSTYYGVIRKISTGESTIKNRSK